MDRYRNIDPRLWEIDQRQRTIGDIAAPTAHSTDTNPTDSIRPVEAITPGVVVALTETTRPVEGEQPHNSGSLFEGQDAAENAATRARRQRSAMIRELAPNQIPRLDPGSASGFVVDHSQEVAYNWTGGAANIYTPGSSLPPAIGSTTGSQLAIEVIQDESATIKKPNKVNRSTKSNKPTNPTKSDKPNKVNKPKKFGSLYNELGKLPLPLAQYRDYMNGDLEMNGKFAEPQVAAVPCERCAEKKLVCKILHRTGDLGHVFSRMRKPWAQFEVSNYTVCGNCWKKAGQAQICSFWKRPAGKEKPTKPHSVNPRPDRNAKAGEEKD